MVNILNLNFRSLKLSGPSPSYSSSGETIYRKNDGGSPSERSTEDDIKIEPGLAQNSTPEPEIENISTDLAPVLAENNGQQPGIHTGSVSLLPGVSFSHLLPGTVFPGNTVAKRPGPSLDPSPSGKRPRTEPQTIGNRLKYVCKNLLLTE